MVAHIMNKKAFSYSFLALLFILTAMLMFISDDSNMKEDAFYDSRLVKSLDNKIDSATEDISRGMYISGLRGIIVLENIVATEGRYLDDIDSTFSEAFINGTYDSQELLLMQNSSMEDVTAKIEDAFAQDGINLKISVNSADLSQESPWSVTITINATIDMTDRTRIAHWNTTQIIKKSISIVELNDPVYYIETEGFVHNQIFKTNITDFVDGTDTSGLKTHLENSYYVKSSSAPNYLMRLQGDFGSDENGIESLVNLEELKDQGLNIYNNSAVDYLYFTDTEGDHQVQNMPSWFYIDAPHTDYYEVSAIIK